MISFAALRCRDFRLYWVALVVSAVGTWMQIVAQSLVVLRLSDGNATYLGFVALAQASAFFLFALAGGSIADRLDRRRLLLLTSSLLMLIAFLVGVLVAAHAARVWMIVAAAFISGIVLSFDQPARAAFLPSLVADTDLLSAISLQSTVFIGASAVAPILAGWSIEHFGLAANFFLNSSSYVAVILILLSLRHRSIAIEPVRRAGPLWESIHSGLQAVRRDRGLIWAVSGYGLLLFAAPSTQILLPVLADRVLHARATSLGILFALFGAGAIAGSFLTAWLGNCCRKRTIYLAAFAIWVCAMSMLAWTQQTVVYAVALLLIGGAQNAISVITITLMQSRVAKEMRGRVMSIQTLMNMGLRPLGDFPISIAITHLGAPDTAGWSAALIGSYTFYLVFTRNRLRDGT